jgi:hypothetical protein
MNSLRSNRSTTIPFDEIKIKAKERYPVEEEIEKDVINLNKIKPLPPKSIGYNKSVRNKKESKE